MLSERDYIEDAVQYNTWWRGEAGDLADAAQRHPHPALAELLSAIVDDEKRIVPVAGQRGVGCTTLLKQLTATFLAEDCPGLAEPPDTRYQGPLDAAQVEPSQLLYLPLSESLYQLETEREDRIEEILSRVLEYYRTSELGDHDDHYIVLDDVGSISRLGDDDWKDVVLDLLDEHTTLVCTGTTPEQVQFDDVVGRRLDDDQPSPVTPEEVADTTLVLPESFPAATERRDRDGASTTGSDTSEDATPDSGFGGGRGGLLAPRNDHLDRLLGDLWAAFRTGSPERTVGLIERIYLEQNSAEKDRLRDAVDEYIQGGGFPGRTVDEESDRTGIRDELLLTLYRELGQHGSISNPSNLEKVCDFAAEPPAKEIPYTDIADLFGVDDRRTVDANIDLLAASQLVSVAHDYTLERHRRGKFCVRDSAHVAALTQRQTRDADDAEYRLYVRRILARDHLHRLDSVFAGGDTPSHQKETVSSDRTPVEYADTSAGLVDFVVTDSDTSTAIPFALALEPDRGPNDAFEALAAFDAAEHGADDGSTYSAPVGFVVTDSATKFDAFQPGTLTEETPAQQRSVCYLPYWLFLTLCGLVSRWPDVADQRAVFDRLAEVHRETADLDAYLDVVDNATTFLVDREGPAGAREWCEAQATAAENANLPAHGRGSLVEYVGRFAQDMGDIETARDNYTQAIEYFETAGATDARARVTWRKALTHLTNGLDSPETARDLLQDALALAEESPEVALEVHYALAELYCEQDSLEQAWTETERALEAAEELAVSETSTASLAHQRARIAVQRGDVQTAIESIERELETLDASTNGSAAQRDWQLGADLRRSLARIQSQHDDTTDDQARDILDKALGTVTHHGDQRRQSVLHRLRGLIDLQQGYLDDAEGEFLIARNVATDADDYTSIGHALLCLGVVRQKHGDKTQAKERYSEAKNAFQKGTHDDGVALVEKYQRTLERNEGPDVDRLLKEIPIREDDETRQTGTIQ